MPYKYQGFGAGPTTRGQMIGLTIALVVVIAIYGGVVSCVVSKQPKPEQPFRCTSSQYEAGECYPQTEK